VNENHKPKKRKFFVFFSDKTFYIFVLLILTGVPSPMNKIPSVMSFGDFWLIAKIPNLFIHIIYMP
jgi:hypothetical protein